MKVFISWSKERSRLVAELFNSWIKCVIQSVHPWISTQDIQDGELWFPAINNQVAEISTGVIFITQENKNEPWILFEAGGLAKGLDKNRLVLFLVDLESKDLLLSPLTAFNQTKNDKDGVRRLVGNINKWIPSPLEPQTLDAVFEKFWPDFENDFTKIMNETESNITTKIKTSNVGEVNNDMLVEILKTVRGLGTQQNAKVSRITPPLIISRNRAYVTVKGFIIKNKLGIEDIERLTFLDVRKLIDSSYPGNFIARTTASDIIATILEEEKESNLKDNIK